MKALILIAALFCFQGGVSAQNQLIDSLESRLLLLKEDSAKVNFINDLALKYQHLNPERAMTLVNQSAALAQRLKFDIGLGVAYRLTGVLYVDKTDFVKGAEYYRRALALFKDIKDARSRRFLGMLDHNFGVIHHYKGEYDSAVLRYQAAAAIYKSPNDDALLFLTYNNLSTLYGQLIDNVNSLKYARECVAISKRLNDPFKISVASLAMASAKIELKDYAGIDTLVAQIISISKSSSNYYMLGKGYKILGQYQNEFLHDNKSAILNMKLALENMMLSGNEYEVASAHQNLGFVYAADNRLAEAAVEFKSALEMGKRLGIMLVQRYSLKSLSELEEQMGHYKQALAYMHEHLLIKDSIIDKTHQDNIQALEAKYQSGLKDARIVQFADEQKIQLLSLRQKATLNYILLASVAALLVLGFLGYRNFRHRQQLSRNQDQLQQQQIRELEKDKQLIAVDFLLKGQEEERSRLAKDLHDGLGGLLSGVKFSLSNMKDNLIITPENMTVFERSLDMIDGSIKELRRVAHNMMPEMLTKFGLDEALKEYCNTLNATKLLSVRFQSFGLTDRLDTSTEIIIYRIIQELLNNTLKHASATEAFVQLVREKDRINVQVEDNGKGFDTAILEDSKGSGWVSIRSRVDYLKGKIEVHSAPGKGSSVNIEFEV